MTKLILYGPRRSSLTHKNNVQIARLLTGTQKGSSLLFMGNPIGTILDVAISQEEQLIFTVDFPNDNLIPEDVERYIVQAQVLAEIDENNIETIIKVEDLILTIPSIYEQDREAQYLKNGEVKIEQDMKSEPIPEGLVVIEETIVKDEKGNIKSKTERDITKDVELVIANTDKPVVKRKRKSISKAIEEGTVKPKRKRKTNDR